MKKRNIEKIIEILHKLSSEVREKHKPEIKGVFGSFVKGRNKKNSDRALLVKFYDGASLIDLVGIVNFIEKKLKIKVDVVPIDVIRDEIKGKILKEARCI